MLKCRGLSPMMGIYKDAARQELGINCNIVSTHSSDIHQHKHHLLINPTNPPSNQLRNVTHNRRNRRRTRSRRTSPSLLLPFPSLPIQTTNNPQLEWVRQLSLDPSNLIIAVIRNPSTLLTPLLGPKVVVVKADLSDFSSFPAVASEIAKLGGGKIDVLIKCVFLPRS